MTDRREGWKRAAMDAGCEVYRQVGGLCRWRVGQDYSSRPPSFWQTGEASADDLRERTCRNRIGEILEVYRLSYYCRI
jgi:hypothetical protein